LCFRCLAIHTTCHCERKLSVITLSFSCAASLECDFVAQRRAQSIRDDYIGEFERLCL
jgi:hypothetical protein